MRTGHGGPLLPATGVILAGGRNSRMNAPKAFLEVGGASIIERQVEALGQVFDEVMVVTGEPGRYNGMGVRAVGDEPSVSHARCPMTGVYTALVNASNPHCFVVGCDMPFIDPALMRLVAGPRSEADIIVPLTGGYPEPLFGVYSGTVADAMRSALISGVRKLTDVFDRLNVLYVTESEMRAVDPGLHSLMNVNTPTELAAARDIAHKEVLQGPCGER